MVLGPKQAIIRHIADIALANEFGFEEKIEVDPGCKAGIHIWYP